MALEIRKPKVCTDGAARAHQMARDLLEPVFVPASFFADDRGWSLMNLLQGVMAPEGQINYSTQYPGVIKAWHRHTLQTDFWICLRGHIKVGVQKEGEAFAWLQVIGEKAPGVMVIPPPLWHGAATVGEEPAGLFYYVTHAYNAASPDEQRRAYDALAGFPWGVRHG